MFIILTSGNLLVNKTELQDKYLSGTYYHKTVQDPLDITRLENWLYIQKNFHYTLGSECCKNAKTYVNSFNIFLFSYSLTKIDSLYDDDLQLEDAENGRTGNGDHVTGNVRHEAGSSSGGKDSNDPVGDFDVEEPSYQDMLHGNVRRMSNTVSCLSKNFIDDVKEELPGK